MDLSKDITEAIEKQLPAAVGDVLRARLEKADRDEKRLAQVEDALAGKARDLTAAQNRAAGLEADLKKHGELSKRETDVAERERNIKIRELQQDLNAAQYAVTKAYDLMHGLVRNIEYRRTVSGSTTAPNPQAGYGCNTPLPFNNDTTSQAE